MRKTRQNKKKFEINITYFANVNDFCWVITRLKRIVSRIEELVRNKR